MCTVTFCNYVAFTFSNVRNAIMCANHNALQILFGNWQDIEKKKNHLLNKLLLY